MSRRLFRSEQGSALLLVLFIVFTLVVRLRYLPYSTGDWDAIDFALALDRFDLLSLQPHFPGYPVFIGIAKLVQPFVGSPVLTLTVVSASFGALTLLPLYGLALMLTRSVRASLLAAAFYSLNPLLSLTQVQPMSESLGMFFVVAVLCAASLSLHYPAGHKAHGRIALLSAFLYAVTMGVRISYFPIIAACLLPLWKLAPVDRLRISLQFILTGLGTGLLWLLPIAATEGGIVPYLKLGVAFTKGHFYDWGGTAAAMTSSSFVADWVDRLQQWIWVQGIWAGLAGSAPSSWNVTTSLLIGIPAAIILGQFKRLKEMHTKEQLTYIILVIAAYSLWLVLGQNPEKPRHILPLLPFVCISIAAGVSRLLSSGRPFLLRFGIFAAAALYCVSAWDQAQTLLRENQKLSPTTSLVAYASEHLDPQKAVLFTWEEQRAFHYYAPSFLVTRVQRYDYFTRLLEGHVQSGRRIFLTNKVVEGFEKQGKPITAMGRLRTVQAFTGHPVVHPVYHHVILYEFEK